MPWLTPWQQRDGDGVRVPDIKTDREKRMITVDLTADEGDLVRAAALGDTRTPTAYVRALIRGDLQSRGFVDVDTQEVTERGQKAIAALPPPKRGRTRTGE